MNSHVLIIDDHVDFTRYLKKILEIKQYSVDVENDPVNAKALFPTTDYCCVLLDVMMPNISGLEMLNYIVSQNPDVPVIMMSSYGSIDVALQAINNGAVDFIEKPVDVDNMVSKLSKYDSPVCCTNGIDSKLEKLSKDFGIVAYSPAMKQILLEIETICQTDARVLILGETGSGKEVVARAIHEGSRRKNKPYIQINCAAIPTELLESELFGYKKGAFTGANHDHRGKFLSANTGTLLLDEIADMDRVLQSKILRAVQENEIEILGTAETKKIDVRIISSTNKDLKALTDAGKFRTDLYHRLNVISIHIPPLRDRKEDIVPLANHFLDLYSKKYDKKSKQFTRSAQAVLENQKYPGNVRELKNIVEKIVVFSNNEKIDSDEVYQAFANRLTNNGTAINDTKTIVALKDANQNFEKSYILNALEKNDWKINKTAAQLKIDRTNLFKKMKKHGIN